MYPPSKTLALLLDEILDAIAGIVVVNGGVVDDAAGFDAGAEGAQIFRPSFFGSEDGEVGTRHLLFFSGEFLQFPHGGGSAAPGRFVGGADKAVGSHVGAFSLDAFFSEAVGSAEFRFEGWGRCRRLRIVDVDEAAAPGAC